MEEQDLTNFSTSSSSHHRLPTITASEAVQNASARSSRSISTGLPGLDSALAGPRAARPNSASPCQGLPRGSVTEIYGPPGVGKTAFAIQAAVNALQSHSHSSSSSSARNEVVWIDTGAPLPGPRFSQVFSAAASRTTPPTTQDPPSSQPATESSRDLLDRVHYISAPSLAHLLVLFLHPTPTFPPQHTALVVVDNVSALFATSFPRPSSLGGSHATTTSGSATTTFADSARRKAANRKWAVAGDLAGGMARMAGRHDCAVLVVNQVATSLLKNGSGGGVGGGGVRKAMLKPSLGGNGWEAGVQGRILLYWDFAPREHDHQDDGGGGGGGVEELRRDRDGKGGGGGMRFAEVVKVSGKVVGTGTGTGTTTTTSVVVPFIIEDAGLREIRIRSLTSTSSSSPSTPLLTSSIATEGAQEGDRTLKRKADEIADSEEDDEDEGMGSEDDLGVLPDEFLA